MKKPLKLLLMILLGIAGICLAGAAIYGKKSIISGNKVCKRVIESCLYGMAPIKKRSVKDFYRL